MASANSDGDADLTEHETIDLTQGGHREEDTDHRSKRSHTQNRDDGGDIHCCKHDADGKTDKENKNNDEDDKEHHPDYAELDQDTSYRHTVNAMLSLSARPNDGTMTSGSGSQNWEDIERFLVDNDASDADEGDTA